MSVWGVTAGSYSDYHIVFIADSKEIAELYVAEHDALVEEGNILYDEMSVEEFPTSGSPQYLSYYASASPHRGMEVSSGATIEEAEAPLRPEVVYPNPGHSYGFIQATCRDKDAAIKAVKDRLAAEIASGSFVPEDYSEVLSVGVNTRNPNA